MNTNEKKIPFDVFVVADDGDYVHILVEAEKKKFARLAVTETEQYVAFVEKHGVDQIKKIRVEYISQKPRNNVLTLANDLTRDNWYIVDHHRARIRVQFRKGNYRAMSVWFLDKDEKTEPSLYKEELREIEEWLICYFPDIILPSPFRNQP